MYSHFPYSIILINKLEYQLVWLLSPTILNSPFCLLLFFYFYFLYLVLGLPMFYCFLLISNSSVLAQVSTQITFFVFYSLIAHFTYLLAFYPMFTYILTICTLMLALKLHFLFDFNLIVVFLYCLAFCPFLPSQLHQFVCYVPYKLTFYNLYFPIKNITSKLYLLYHVWFYFFYSCI